MENNRPNRLSIDTDAKTGKSELAIAGTIPQLLFNLTVLTAAVCDETGIPSEAWGAMLPGVTYLTGTGGVVQKLRRDSIQRMKGRIRTWREEYPAGKITKEKIIEQWTSWDAHAAHGDTHALREKIAGQVGDIIGEKLTPRRKITSSERVKALRKARAARLQAKKQDGGGASPFGTFSSEPRPDTILPWE